MCYTQKWVTHWYFKFWVFTFWNLWPKIKCRVALTKVYFDPDFLAFRSVYFLQQTRLWQTVNQLNSHHSYITLNGFTRNAKHGFNFWKWSNLAWNSSSSFTIDFSILPLCGLQLPLRETHWFSFRHWENNRMRLICVFEIFQFSSAKKLA